MPHQNLNKAGMNPAAVREKANQVRSYRRRLAVYKTKIENDMFERGQDMFLLPHETKAIQALQTALDTTHHELTKSGHQLPPSRMENQKVSLAKRMQTMILFSFEIGSRDGDAYIFDYNFSNNQIIKTSYKRCNPKISSTIVLQTMTKADFIYALYKIDLVDWEKRYKEKGLQRQACENLKWALTIRWKSRGYRDLLIEGFNDFPYNFEQLLSLIQRT
ncbi:hypothetical protein IM774_06265 [Erysipelotrichaceae bacterium RD49]|nr:hypothetical protein [Erysipelotrichaceae bacterium RD49]